MTNLNDDSKLKNLEAANLKLEFEISQLYRENSRLHDQISQLHGRGVKVLMHTIIDKIDNKITVNLKKLNKPVKSLAAAEDLEHNFSKQKSRQKLLESAEIIDLKTFYNSPKQRLSFLIPFKTYKALFWLFNKISSGLWWLWAFAKKILKGLVK